MAKAVLVSGVASSIGWKGMERVDGFHGRVAPAWELNKAKANAPIPPKFELL